MIFDVSDKTWEKYFTRDEILEIANFEKKERPTIPASLTEYIDLLRQCDDPTALKATLTKEQECEACEWVRTTLLDFLKRFKHSRQLVSRDQTKEDLLRRVWVFLDTVLDDSKINCIGYVRYFFDLD